MINERLHFGLMSSGSFVGKLQCIWLTNQLGMECLFPSIIDIYFLIASADFATHLQLTLVSTSVVEIQNLIHLNGNIPFKYVILQSEFLILHDIYHI